MTVPAVVTTASYEQVSTKGLGGIVVNTATDNVMSYHYTADAEI